MTFFLDLKIHQSANGILINQQKYITDVIDLANLKKFTPVDTPLEVNLKLRKDDGDLFPDPKFYKHLVGSLVYLTIIWPDMSYAVNLMSQFMSAPRHLHLAAIRRIIIHYILGTPTREFFFSANNSLTLTEYSDADWVGYHDTHYSTTRRCMYLSNALISRKCKKQECVSKSSTKAEYRAMSSTCSETFWLRSLLSNFGFAPTSSTPRNADNTGAINSLKTKFFMSSQSTLRWIAILFGTNTSERLLIFLIYLRIFKLLISPQRGAPMTMSSVLDFQIDAQHSRINLWDGVAGPLAYLPYIYGLVEQTILYS